MDSTFNHHNEDETWFLLHGSRKKGLRDRYLKSLSAYLQRQDLLSTQVTTDILFIWQRGCGLNSWLKKRTSFPNEDIWRVLMAIARHVAGYATVCELIKTQGVCISGEWWIPPLFKSKKILHPEKMCLRGQALPAPRQLDVMSAQWEKICSAAWMAFSLTLPNVSV